MDQDSEYIALAEQAERLGDQAQMLDRRIARSWLRIASGFRELARLRGTARRRWQRITEDGRNHPEPQY